jgi:Ca2+-transporting ATPase
MSVLEICEYCNESKLVNAGREHRVLGDPTEGALKVLAAKHQHHNPEVTFKNEVVTWFPFHSERKMMSVVVNKPSAHKVLVKGSPDDVLEKCTHWSDGEKIHKLDVTKRAKIQQHYERMAENALRVLAFAVRSVEGDNLPENEAEAEQGLTFLGLVGMIDPPRSEVRAAVSKCRTAGIRVIVITGDFGITAEAIARELGIVHGKKVTVLTGKEVKKMSDRELKKMLKNRDRAVIFARSLPEQKMRIVQLLQEQGEIVAMTGDGVNDAPALKKSDIGIAMGITGTEVSKEAATMILMNDSFASIVTAVAEGRRIYENLKKFIWFIFSCNIGELVVIFAAILFQFPLPLTAVLILSVDLGTDILPAIALGVDEAEEGLMQKKPRPVGQRLMRGRFVWNFLWTGLAIGVTVTGAFLWTVIQDGWTWSQGAAGDWHHATTVAFAALVMVQLVNAFSARSDRQSIFKMSLLSNHFLVLAVLSSVLLVLVMLYVPGLNTALKTTPLGWGDWVVVMVASLLPLVVVEGRKMIVRKAN